MTVIEGHYLSPQQKRLWRSKKGRNLGRAVLALRIEGHLRIDDLQEALAQTAERHELLHTRIVKAAFQKLPMLVGRDDERAFFWEHLTNVTSLETLIEEEVNVDSEPDEALTLRARLSPISDGVSLLVLSVPSILCDGASLNVLARDLFLTYAAVAGQAEDLEEPVAYSQYNEWLDSLKEEEEGGQVFWIDYLETLPEVGSLSVDSGKSGQNQNQLSIKIPSDIKTRITSLAESMDVEPFQVIASAWSLLLARRAALVQHTLDLAFPCRSFEELEDSVGLFNRSLPVRFDHSDTFENLLRAAASQISDITDWQDYYELEEIREAPDAYAFEYQPVFTHSVMNLTIREAARYHGPAAAPLKLTLLDGDQWQGVLEYDTARFQADHMEDLLQQCLVLLDQVTTHPSTACASFSLMTSEVQQLVDTYRHLCEEAVDPKPICQRIEQHAEITPSIPALVFQDENGAETTLTYAQLNTRANIIAHSLIQEGAAPDKPVALLFHRSADMIVALVGVLKSGSPYLPLDPFTPVERVKHIISESASVVLLTHPQIDAPELDVPTIDVQTLSINTDQGNPDISVYPQHLAYLIYTSGSTGTPKGVAVTHANISNYTAAVTSRLELDLCDSFALISTLGADLGNTSIFPALTTGATLHILAQNCIGDAQALSSYFKKHQVNALKITPSHLGALLHGDNAANVLPKRNLILGGEAASPELLQRIRKLAPQLRIDNHYGPSEACVGVTTYPISGSETSYPPLGKPMANSGITLMNGHATAEPPHTPAEICLGGANLVRGYLNDPVMTASKFIPDPSNRIAGARLYRTGDLGLLTPQGLFFKGRIDHQVKIRGYRVEPGEIEARLKGLTEVHDAAVMVRDEKLLAYVVLQDGVAFDQTQLSESLSHHVPEYMVPSFWAHLPRLPLTPNGKLDRKALPEPSTDRKADYVAPRNDVEEALAAIWEQLLGVEQIGVHDDFFEVGGHSLLIFQLLSQVQKQFSTILGVRDIFKHASVAKLAERIENGKNRILNPLQTEGVGTPWFCVHPINGQIHWFRHLAAQFAGKAPFYALQSPALFEEDITPYEDITQVAETYIAAIREAQPTGPYRLAGWSAGGAIAIEMARRLELQGEIVERVVLIDARSYADINLAAMESQAFMDLLNEFDDDIREIYQNHSAELNDLPGEQRIHALFDKVKSENKLPEGLEPGWFLQRYKASRSIARAVAGYTPEPLHTRINLVRASETVRSLMAVGNVSRYDSSLGWKRLGLRNFYIYDVEGNHISIFSEDKVDALYAVFELDNPNEHADVHMGTVGRLWLDDAVESTSTNRIISAIVGLYEANFPNRVSGYYLTGSYSKEKAMEGSDLDMFIIFGGCLTTEEYHRAFQMSTNLSALSPVALDLKIHDESELERMALIDLKGTLHIYGPGFTNQIGQQQLQILSRYQIHSYPINMMVKRNQATFLSWPLQLPNPDVEYFGYVQLGKTATLQGPTSRGELKKLVNEPLKLARAILLAKHGVHCFEKFEVVSLWRQHMGDDSWADFFQELLDKCRGDWGYHIPKLPWAKKQLEKLCRRALEFENYYLQIYRQLLLDDLRREPQDPVWLNEKEIRDYLQIPDQKIHSEIENGVLQTRHNHGMRFICLPHAFRLAAITALGRFIFDDDEIISELKRLKEEDLPFQANLVQFTLNQVGKAKLLKSYKDPQS